MATAALPLFHLYGDPPDDQAFDFIHIETIASRSSIHDWTIRAHRHRNLFQILVIERGGGDMTFEAATIPFAAPCAILVPATIAHGFRFQPVVTDGWVTSFTEDVAGAMGDRRGEALGQLKALAAEPVVTLGDDECQRLSRLCAELHEEGLLARVGYRIAMRGLLVLIAVEVARLAAGRVRAAALASEASGQRGDSKGARAGHSPELGSSARAAPTREPTGATVEALRKLLEEHFHQERQLAFYADKLAMTVDRLNDHVRRATGVTAGHLIRQRVLTEAKRQLVFTSEPIHEIAYALAFSDPSHFARFFRKQTGTTPHEFREARGG